MQKNRKLYFYSISKKKNASKEFEGSKYKYSNIKHIFLELHDYRYFHNPSKKGQLDDRFIGRKKLIAKLKGLLNSSETRSGAYLITGFRGMGKSSLVSRVLDEVGPISIQNSLLNRMIRVLALSFLFTILLKFNDYSFDFNFMALLVGFFVALSAVMSFNQQSFKDRKILSSLSFFLGFILLIYLIKDLSTLGAIVHLGFPVSVVFLTTRSRRKNDLFNTSFWEGLKNWMICVLTVFDIRKEKYSKANYYYFSQELNIVFGSSLVIGFLNWLASLNIHLPDNLITHLSTSNYGLFSLKISRFLLSSLDELERLSSLKNFFAVWFLILFFIIIALLISKNIRIIHYAYLNKKLPDWFKLQWVKKTLNYSNRVNIRINLGHASLRETDILKQITKKVYYEYENINKLFWHFPLGLSSKLVRIFAAGFIASTLYLLGNQFNESLLKEYQLDRAVPTLGNRILTLDSNAENVYGLFKADAPRLKYVGWLNDLILYIDLKAYRLYRSLYTQTEELFPNAIGWVNNALTVDFGIGKKVVPIPQKPDYLFLIYAFLTYQAISIFTFLRPFGIGTHKSIRSRLKELNDRIEAHLLKESSSTAGGAKTWFRLFRLHRKSYPLADIREIENELLGIFEEIDRVPKIFTRLEFVFVFDELDKVEANKNVTIKDKEEEEVTISDGSSAYSSSEQQTRRRSQAVAQILSNLKHFFTTARAKFIFIASREMYDASLADISDRDYFLGSIFHDIIYVNSFLVEERNPTKISTEAPIQYDSNLVEEYLCNFLIPKNYKPTVERSLQTFSLYCKDRFNGKDIYTVIFTLRKFINYLQYRSSGSPKKITFLLEKYADPGEKVLLKKAEEETKAIVLGRNSTNFYLHFDFNAIYTFSLINYITKPYTYQISRSIRRRNDKLLVSTTYILDHLLKYHNFGFSWRNLELTPEIIDVNKAPILRDIITHIIEFLQTVHLDSVTSGLFDFTFNKRIANEITYLSKINEDESAAFNFTLDESQEIKRHYNRKLNNLQSNYRSGKTSINEFIHSVSFIHGNLGDLHYYDQEYDDAIVAYKDAVQPLRGMEGKELKLDQLAVYVRLMLKLSLTLEKKKSFTSSLLILDELCNCIYDRFRVKLEDIALVERYNEEEQLEIVIVDKLNNSHSCWGLESHTLYDIKANGSPDEINLAKYISQLPTSSSYHQLTSLVQSATSVRMFLQPFIAKLHIKEKEKIGGITQFDLNQFQRELNFILILVPPHERKLIRSEYYNKIGDLLFYKNYKVRKEGTEDLHYYHKSLDEMLSLNNSAPCASDGIEKICKIIDLLGISYTNSKRSIFYYEKGDSENGIEKISVRAFKILGNNLSDLGDSWLTQCRLERPNASKHFKLSASKTLDLVEVIERLLSDHTYLMKQGNKDPNNVFGENISFLSYNFLADPLTILNADKYQNSIITACIYYALSAQTHILNDDLKKASSQLLKILYVIEDNLDDYQGNQLTDRIEEVIVVRYLDLIYLTYDSSTRTELEHIKKLFKWENLDTDQFKYVTSQLPSYADVQESMAIFNMIQLKNSDYNFENQDYVMRFLSVQSGSIHSRMATLHFKIRYNYKSIFYLAGFINDDKTKWEQLLQDKIDSCADLEELHQIARLTTDSIFCLNELLLSYKTMTIKRLSNNSVVAFSYQRRAWWLALRSAILKKVKRLPRTKSSTMLTKILKSDLELLTGTQASLKFKVKYNGDRARHYYLKSIQVHEGREAYNQISQDMYYLDDDYNDEHYHFHTALERNRINSNRLIVQMEALGQCVKGDDNIFPYKSKGEGRTKVSNLFKLENYY